jgi:hypothetical protein
MAMEFESNIPRYLFDRKDYELIQIVAEFLGFVGIGQKSKLHLTKLIHDQLFTRWRRSWNCSTTARA